MSAQNVWNCIKSYESGWAHISKDYAYDESLIVSTLSQKYANLDAYHGHESGKAGDGVHQGAADNRAAAMQCLRTNKPTVFVAQVKKAVNTVAKNQSINKTTALANVIEKNGNLGEIVQQLNALDPLWRDNKTVWAAYAMKYRAKKNGKEPVKA